MTLFLKRLLYVVISILWSLILLTFITPFFIFLITGIRWGEVLEYSHDKLFGYGY